MSESEEEKKPINPKKRKIQEINLEADDVEIVDLDSGAIQKGKMKQQNIKRRKVNYAN